MPAGRVIAVVGAESTGKTVLAQALGQALRQSVPNPERSVAVVSEYLREFCDRHQRTPRIDEQAAIAAEQTRRIEQAAAAHDIVIADTTALMIGVYSEQVFGDTSLYAETERAHARCHHTLLMALDLPWLADGLQRDGPHVREPVDRLVRASLVRAGSAYSVIGGAGEQRLAHALASVQRALDPPANHGTTRWQWVCERCGDAGCERHLLPRP